MNNSVLIIFILMILGTSPNNANAFWYELKSPYPAFKREILAEKNSQFSCKKAPLPPLHLKFVSKYDQNDPSRSTVNKKSDQNYISQTAVIRTYEKNISDSLELFYKNTRKQNLDCAINLINNWAKQNAMLEIETSSQGQAVRKWHLAVIASHYVQIKNLMLIDKSKKRNIEAWLTKMAIQIMKDYPLKSDRLFRNNNHQYWAAWSVMITGVALNDRTFYNYGVRNFNKAMKQVNDDGALPLELNRKSKALHYHLFALSPLVMMAQTAKYNGLNLYKYRNNALEKLIKFTLRNLNNNQIEIAELSGAKQNLERTITAGQLAWLIPYNKNYNNAPTQKWIKKLSPMRQRRIGGNLSLIYAR